MLRTRVEQESEVRNYPNQSFDAREYLEYIRRRFRFLMAVCSAAGVLALVVSLFLPKQYTATASIAIDPPAVTIPVDRLWFHRLILSR